MSVDLDNPSPECAEWARLLETATKERNALRAENKRLRDASAIQQLTTERLATLLAEELDRDGWGDIEPYWIEMVAAGNYTEEDDHHDQAEAMGKVLDRVVARLKAGAS